MCVSYDYYFSYLCFFFSFVFLFFYVSSSYYYCSYSFYVCYGSSFIVLDIRLLILIFIIILIFVILILLLLLIMLGLLLGMFIVRVLCFGLRVLIIRVSDYLFSFGYVCYYYYVSHLSSYLYVCVCLLSFFRLVSYVVLLFMCRICLIVLSLSFLRLPFSSVVFLFLFLSVLC